MTIIAGNWKMNHDPESSISFLEEFESYGSVPEDIKTVIFPTFLCLFLLFQHLPPLYKLEALGY